MTYTASFVMSKGSEDVLDVFDPHSTGISDQVEASQPDALRAAGDHISMLSDVLPKIVDAVGPDDGQVQVSITGHANPDHATTGGWANESLTIVVNHVS